MPSLMMEDIHGDPKYGYELDPEDRIDARLHPAKDMKGGRPTTRFKESPQKQDGETVTSKIQVSDYDQVVCSMNVYHFVRRRVVMIFEIEATVNDKRAWKATYTTFSLEKQALKNFLVSPVLKLQGLQRGTICIHLHVVYEQDPKADAEFTEPTDHHFNIKYTKYQGDGPILFDPKWLPPIPHERKIIKSTASDVANSGKLKRYRIEEGALEQPETKGESSKRPCIPLNARRSNQAQEISPWEELAKDTGS